MRKQGDVSNYPIAGNSTFTNGSFTLGFEFSPTEDITVTALGDFFPSGSTLTQGVSLWTAGGTLLATTQVTGQGVSQGQGFDFSAIAPVVLTAGQDYVVGGTTQTDPYYCCNNPGAGNLGPFITYITHAEVGAAGNTPSFPSGQYPSFSDFGGNFQYTAVPEPATWAMMIVGFGGLAFAGYRTSRRGAALA